MNDLDVLESWLKQIIKENEIAFKVYSQPANEKEAQRCVTRGIAYDRMLAKVQAMKHKQKEGK